MSNQKMQSNARKLRRVRQDRDYVDLDIGRIGRLASDGTIDPAVDVAGKSGYIWIRQGLNGERGQAQVINAGVNTAFLDAPIKIGTRPNDGERCAYAPEFNSETVNVYGNNLVSVGIPIQPSSADTQIKNSTLINVGRVSPSTLSPNTLFVRIAPFWVNGMLLGDIEHDVGASNVPATANQSRWCLICVDANNSSYTVAGTNLLISSIDAMLVETAESIVVPVGYIPVGLLTLSYAQSAIKDSRFEDGRYWLAQRGYLLSEASTTLTIASGVITAASASNIVVAAQSGTADDLDTITMSGTPRLIVLQADAGDTITVKHSTGNIELNGGVDFALSGDKTLMLFWDGTNLADVSPVLSGTGTYYQTVKDAGTPLTQRIALNFVAGSGVTLTIADDAGNNETDVTIAATSTPGGDYICIRDEKTQNTDGGTFTSGAWRVRDLNTETADTGGDASLSSNQITLTAGSYRCRIIAPATQCGRHQAQLYNTTDAATTIIGTSEFSGAAASTVPQTASVIAGRFTIAGSKTFEVQHQCEVTKATVGFGVASNFTTEVYTVAEFWRE